jgi:D-arabinose 1-dehydrogenase-like Zn-dependent alcohol dehydrogenase
VDAVATVGFVAQHRSPATELNPGLILARRANVKGISVGSTQMFEAANRAVAANGIKPVIVHCSRLRSIEYARDRIGDISAGCGQHDIVASVACRSLRAPIPTPGIP